MKKPRSKPKKPRSTIPALDQIFGCCRRIETIAGLLEGSERSHDDASRYRQAIRNAGFLIADETARLREWLGKLPRP